MDIEKLILKLHLDKVEEEIAIFDANIERLRAILAKYDKKEESTHEKKTR